MPWAPQDRETKEVGGASKEGEEETPGAGAQAVGPSGS